MKRFRRGILLIMFILLTSNLFIHQAQANNVSSCQTQQEISAVDTESLNDFLKKVRSK